MKKYLLLISSVLLLASCSTPKYAYHFDHYDYNSGKKKAQTEKTRLAQQMLATPETSPLQINEEAIVASAERTIVPIERKAPPTVSVEDQKAFAAKYAAMSKSEKKEFRKELKSEIKSIIKAKKSGENVDSVSESKALDRNLRLALIFGIVGIVLYALSGVNPIFWILGIIATVIAIVFLIQWIAEQ